MRPESYIGVSGVISQEQQSLLLDMYEQTGLKEHGRILALGVKAVHKTQFLDVANRYGTQWYPVGEEAFQESLKNADATASMGVAQVYFDPEMIDNPGYREFFSDRIFRRGAPWIDGIQFDMLPWHSDPAMLTFLEKLKSKHNTKLLLQVHGQAMETLGPKGVVETLSKHAEILDYVLFDASHGKGKRLDIEKLLPFLQAAYEDSRLANVGISLAGGLNGSVVEQELESIVSEFPDISWDAEGQLHTLDDKRELPLNMSVVREYMVASEKVLQAS